jgi:hypothetical protein
VLLCNRNRTPELISPEEKKNLEAETEAMKKSQQKTTKNNKKEQTGMALVLLFWNQLTESL